MKKDKLSEEQDNSIVILICYYGQFPWYFSYFLHTCKYNPNVDFVIISDKIYDRELPENVTFTNLPWKEINEFVRKKLDLKVKIEFPYKLCDFKPAYGVIFSELIKDYKFWGHGDIDVIFGQIREFITDDVLDNHDLICLRHDFLTGYFTLFRNCPKMNQLFRNSKDYKKVFTRSKHYCFDETNFAFDPFTEGLSPERIRSEIESMTHVVKKLDKKNFINAYFDFHVIEGTPGKLKWKDGILTYKDKFEVILYHLIKFKRVCNSDPMQKIPKTFYISPTTIYA
jgi:hypothetical protein